VVTNSTRRGKLLLRAIQAKPRLSTFLIGCVFALFMSFCAEGGFYLLNQQTALFENSIKGMFQADKHLGYKPKPNMQFSSKKTRKKDGKVVYDVVYSIDTYGRRITPVSNAAGRTEGFILYFGGSFTFGEGVNDNETMPFYVSQFAPKRLPYNYGFRGYGPQQMLANLQSDKITEEVKSTGRGILVYTFIDDHVRRVIGSIRVLFFVHPHPYYTLDRNDQLVRRGSFTSGRPILTKLYRVMGKSQTLKCFHIDFPKVNERHLRLTARLISESRRIFREKFGSDDFYVLIYPGSTHYGKRLIPFLEKANIKYVDYSNLTFEEIKGDSHPTTTAHMEVAARLSRDLGLLGAGRKNSHE
jgi:hypothetical protein